MFTKVRKNYWSSVVWQKSWTFSSFENADRRMRKCRAVTIPVSVQHSSLFCGSGGGVDPMLWRNLCNMVQSLYWEIPKTKALQNHDEFVRTALPLFCFWKSKLQWKPDRATPWRRTWQDETSRYSFISRMNFGPGHSGQGFPTLVRWLLCS